MRPPPRRAKEDSGAGAAARVEVTWDGWVRIGAARLSGDQAGIVGVVPLEVVSSPGRPAHKADFEAAMSRILTLAQKSGILETPTT
jgi:hypothetical protein